MNSAPFPPGFLWGAATAAYQIEGAVAEDGRGPSIWDQFAHSPGRTLDGDTGDVACDHYHRWREDIAIMRDLGLQAYRFSIAWPRIMPMGRGRVNQAGLDFYSQLVDELLANDITPFATLYHWDLPVSLEADGGWPFRSTAFAFADYAEVVGRHLGDRIKNWLTINEPWVVAHRGYIEGAHAPGRTSLEDGLAAAHHTLLAHGYAAQALRAANSDAKVGIVINSDIMVPRSEHRLDRLAAEQAHESMNRWFYDPIFLGSYPEDAVRRYDWDMGPVFDGDMIAIRQPLDLLGVNYYTRKIHADPSLDDVERPQPIVEADLPQTTMGWEIYPQGLTDFLIRMDRDYDLPPIYLTENGAAFPDEVVDGAIHDDDRVDYLERHLKALAAAIAAGVDVRGYFVWSLLDNFEWARGYAQRFGIVRVDYNTQERIWKDSAHWYREVIAANGSNLG
jgi:beta-glucosidase